MWVTAELFVIGKNRVERGIELGEVFHRRPHFGEGHYAGESGSRLDTRIGRRHSHAVPFFLAWIFRGEEEDFAWPAPRSARCFGVLLSRWKHDQSGAFLVVACQIIEVLFLREDIVLRNFFASGEAPQDDGRIKLGSQFGAPLGVKTVRFAFAPLLRLGRARKKTKSQNCSRRTPPWTTHRFTSPLHRAVFAPRRAQEMG